MGNTTYETALRMLEERGVNLHKIAALVWELQLPYNSKLSLQECIDSVYAVMTKRDVQHAVITGIILDELAEQGKLKEPLGTIVREDDRLYGVDSILGLAIVNMYGSIGMSNYGYLAMDKARLSRCLDRQPPVSTFLDDLVAGIVAATCARIAHGNGRKGEWPEARARAGAD